MKLEELHSSDSVVHRNLGPGTVIENDGSTVTVMYHGKWDGLEARYDANWFRTNPNMLSKK